MILPAPDVLEDDDLLEMVNAGLTNITVADDYLADFWAKVLPGLTVHHDLAVRTDGKLAVAMRKGSPELEETVNAFLRRYAKGDATRNTLERRYLQNLKFAKNATSDTERQKLLQVKALFEKYGKQYDIDYLLMAAQGYQESALDQNAKSSVGAIGMMQVMPATGNDLKVGDMPHPPAFPERCSVARHDTKGLPAFDSVDREICTIRREHGRAVEFFGQRNKRGIRKVHRQIGILVEQLPNALQRRHARRNQKRTLGEKKIDAGGASAVNTGEEVSGFGQHRLGRHQRAGPVGEGTTALQVVRLAAIEKRNECTRVEQQLTGHVSMTRECTHDVAPRGRGSRTTTSR